MKNVIRDEYFKASSKTNKILIAGMLIGALGFSVGLLISPQQAWLSYLVNLFYFTSLALGGMVWLSIASVANAGWLSPFKRLAESLSAFLPIGFILSFGLFFGIHTLYEWSHSEIVQNDPILLGKAAFLNTPGFVVRTIGFFLIWMVLIKVIRHYSKQQDVDGSDRWTYKIQRISPLFLILFALTYTFFSYDWLMSIRPHWFSTIFAIYTFSGLMVNTLAVVVFAALYLKEQGYLSSVISDDHLHDLGKLIFGFSTFWAYIWLSQYLLIWYSNIPEETGYYIERMRHSWDWLFFFNLIINWVIPFFALMSRGAKRNAFILKRVAIVLFVGRWLDIYLMSAPEVFHHAGINHFAIGMVEIAMAMGFASIFCYVYIQNLLKRSLIAKNDPYLEEAIHLHQL